MKITPSYPQVIAHRGASERAPEHTFAAYDLALETGADVLELDIRLTRDRQLVVVHDRTLLRTVGDPRAVDELTLTEIWGLDVPQRPLGLHEVLARYGARARYLLDLKAPAAPVEHLVAKAIARHGLQQNAMVQTFSRRGLRRMRRCDPLLPLSQLYPRLASPEMIRDDLPRVASFANAIGPEAGTVDARLIEAAHRHGLKVYAHTVNDAGDMSRLLAEGLDGVITDAPDRGRAVIDHFSGLERASLAGLAA